MVYKNEFLFSGEANGNVKVWDTKFGTLQQTFSSLKADIFAFSQSTRT